MDKKVEKKKKSKPRHYSSLNIKHSYYRNNKERQELLLLMRVIISNILNLNLLNKSSFFHSLLHQKDSTGHIVFIIIDVMSLIIYQMFITLKLS